MIIGTYRSNKSRPPIHLPRHSLAGRSVAFRTPGLRPGPSAIPRLSSFVSLTEVYGQPTFPGGSGSNSATRSETYVGNRARRLQQKGGDPSCKQSTNINTKSESNDTDNTLFMQKYNLKTTPTKTPHTSCSRLSCAPLTCHRQPSPRPTPPSPCCRTPRPLRPG